jgi:NADH-quinone oxidoreductase subunit C
LALPDAGNVEDYTEAEMMELVKLNETDKSKLTKNQKAAIARYNFKKNKGEPIPFKGSGVAAAPAPAPAAAAAPAAGGDIISLLPPEIQALAKRDPATLSKDEKIALAKAKSQAVRAQAAAGGAPPAADKPKGPSPEELAAQKALTFDHAKLLQERFGAAITGWAMMTTMPYATVQAERIVDVVRYLQMEMGFDQLRDLTATDYPPDRLEVVYNVTRHEPTRAHIALRVRLPRPALPELPEIPTVTGVFQGADWLEREVYDLFGIRFTGHPYLVRLMLPEGWVGHPLRKDYDVKKEQFVGLDERGNDIVSFRSEDGW